MGKEWIKEYKEYLRKQSDIRNLIINSDVEVDYNSFSLSGVLMTSNKYVYPAAAGFDLGCGVAVYELEGQIRSGQIMALQDERYLFGIEEKRYPVSGTDGDEWENIFDKNMQEQWMGGIAAGNHFVEIHKGESDKNYIVVHSGVPEDVKIFFAYFFLTLYRKYVGETGDGKNGYVLKLDKESGDAMAVLKCYRKANYYARKNREYIAEKLAQALGVTGKLLVDSSHEFVETDKKEIVHSNGVQRFREVNGRKIAVIICGEGKENVIVESTGKCQYINHGTKLVTFSDTGRIYCDYSELLKNPEFKGKVKCVEKLQPIISCKNIEGKYEYRIF